DFVQHIAAMEGGRHVLRARRHPCNRSAETARQEACQNVLAMRADLGAEATAHVRGDHPKLLLGHAQRTCEVRTRKKRCLRAEPNGQSRPRRIEVSYQPAWLHGDRGDAVVAESQVEG